MKRVYVISSEKLNIQPKLVSAKSKASAIKHVVGTNVDVKIANKDEIIKYLGSGRNIEETEAKARSWKWCLTPTVKDV